MSYAKEYDEALSRLNAPERSPLPYAPIPYGPVPNYCNYANWNRIMFETRQGNLPKYSIMQRCNFDEQNVLNGGDDSEPYFRYRLDSSFTFAKGDRKSIAVREVKIIPPLEKSEGILTNVVIGMKFDIGFTIVSDGSRLQYKIVQDRENRNAMGLTVKLTTDYVLSMQTMAQRIAEKIWSTIKDQGDTTNTYALQAITQKITGEYKENKLIIKIWFKILVTIDPTTTEILPGNQLFYRDREDFNIYVNASTLKEEAHSIRYGLERDVDGIIRPVIIFEWKVTDHPINYGYGSLCADFNPWTSNNIISGYEFQSDSLTKIYPYNGNDEIKFWFLDTNGERVKYNYARGYVDLELIIDNNNSFAMDA